MNIDPMMVHGWTFQLVGEELHITTEHDPNRHLELPAKAAYSLLDYLYQYREPLHEAAEGESSERMERDVPETVRPEGSQEV